jgi:hypothetical protein
LIQTAAARLSCTTPQMTTECSKTLAAAAAAQQLCSMGPERCPLTTNLAFHSVAESSLQRIATRLTNLVYVISAATEPPAPELADPPELDPLVPPPAAEFDTPAPVGNIVVLRGNGKYLIYYVCCKKDCHYNNESAGVINVDKPTISSCIVACFDPGNEFVLFKFPINCPHYGE